MQALNVGGGISCDHKQDFKRMCSLNMKTAAADSGQFQRNDQVVLQKSSKVRILC